MTFYRWITVPVLPVIVKYLDKIGQLAKKTNFSKS